MMLIVEKLFLLAGILVSFIFFEEGLISRAHADMDTFGCRYDNAFKKGMSDGLKGKDMSTDVSFHCSDKTSAERGYREGYVAALESKKVKVAYSENPQGEGLTPAGVERKCLKTYGVEKCGYDCKSAYGKVECGTEPGHVCVAAYGDVKCGYDCKSAYGKIECGAMPGQNCVVAFGNIQCGFDCKSNFGQIECSSTKDPLSAK